MSGPAFDLEDIAAFVAWTRAGRPRDDVGVPVDVPVDDACRERAKILIEGFTRSGAQTVTVRGAKGIQAVADSLEGVHPDDPRYAGFRATRIWGFFAIDEHDIEGLIAFSMADGTPMPMVATDAARLDQLRVIARGVAADLGQPVYCRSFVLEPDHLEVIAP